MSSETYTTGPELAPSALTEDQASMARTIGMTGLLAVFFSVLLLVLNAAGAKLPVQIPNNVAFGAIVVGMAMMFFHATRDTDFLIRRLYGYIGGMGLPLSGMILSFLPMIISASRTLPEGEERKIVSLFFPFGWACFLAGLFFLIPFCRNESEEGNRRHGLLALLGLGSAMAATGLVLSNFLANFSLSYGPVLALLGLVYLCTYVSQSGGAEEGVGQKAALAIAGFGAMIFLVALVRSVVPSDKPFFIPTGLILMAAGLFYAFVGVFLFSDRQIIVLTRRELSSYFYSPIGYLVLLMVVFISWLSYCFFIYGLAGRPGYEPIVKRHLGDFFGIVTVMIVIPLITMRLVSEEKRSGTYEVLMCAPVSETPVALSKLFGGLIFFVLVWLVWAVYLIALRAENDKPFDFRPVLSYYLTVTVSGASFLAMGLFFSSLTKNQIVAAVLTFAGMLVWLVIYFVEGMIPPGSVWGPVVRHLNFIDLWWESLAGRLHVRDVVIQLSFAVFWTFLTVKVLEARRWS